MRLVALLTAVVMVSVVSASHHFTTEYNYQDGEIVSETGSGESEFSEPAAIVYDIMTKKLSKLERRIQRLENTQCDCNKYYTASEVEQLTRDTRAHILQIVNDRLARATTRVENRTMEAIENALADIPNIPGEVSGISRPTNSGVTPAPAPDEDGRQRVRATTPSADSESLQDCNEAARMGGVSGVYELRLAGLQIDAYCDIDELSGEAWLVIQRRYLGDVDFYRNWTEYERGFGNVSSEGDFWFGLGKMRHITNSINHMLRVELHDEQGAMSYADYNKFKISGEDYRLSYSEYYGTAGDALVSANGKPFSTYDKDQDNSILYNCAKLHRGAFWYDKCGSANLNGVLDTGEESGRSFKWQSVTWYSWYNDLRPMKSVQMKIRPVEY